MKEATRPRAYVFGLWGAIAAISGVAVLVGFAVFSHFSDEVIAATTAVAAGAILAMLADTMIPQGVRVRPRPDRLVTVTGFLVAFVLSKPGERWAPSSHAQITRGYGHGGSPKPRCW
jgi:zinc transporter, ZIP family